MKFTRLIMAVISLIRLPNLVIICLSMYLIRFTIVTPILSYSGLQSSLSENAFLLLVLATILTAAAGNIINDFFDIGIDAINKPKKNLIGKDITKNVAIIIYIFLNIIAIALAWYFGEQQNMRYVMLVFVFTIGLLYFYSSSYKKMFLAGNLVISFLSSLAIWIGILFDHQALSSKPILVLVGAYSIFAFMMNLIREIIKDCEDLEGDMAFGANTLPALTSTAVARKIVALFTLLTAGAIVWIQVYSSQWQNMISFLYTTLFIQIPLLILAIRNIKKAQINTDKTNSLIAKIIMVTGILSMLIFQISSV